MPGIVTVTDQNLESEVYNTQGTVLLDLWAPWCAPCRALSPIIDKLANLAGDKLKVTKMDVEQFPDAMERFGVRGIPALILFKGGEEIGRELGTKTLTQLKQWVGKFQIDLSDNAAPSQEAPSFGAFYGDSELKDFLSNRLLAHAQQDEIIADRDAGWCEGRGTPSAAWVHSADPTVFERVTGLHASFATTFDFLAPSKPEMLEPILNNIKPNADLKLVPLKLVHAMLSEPDFDWPGILSHAKELDGLRHQWLTLCGHLLAGQTLTAVQCEGLLKRVESFRDHPDLSAQFTAELIAALAPPPALTDADAWKQIYNLATNLLFTLGQHMDGWTLEERQTEKRRYEWFTAKQEQTASGEFSEDELETYRAQWMSENAEYQRKEEAFFSNEIQGLKPIQNRLQQLFTSILADSPSHTQA